MLTKKDQYFIDLVRKYAVSTEKVAGARIGAILTIKNRVIAFGTNQYKSHPFQAEYSKNEEAIYLHAEIDAIKNSLKFVHVDELKRATLYIVRVKQESSIPGSRIIYGLAKPCQQGCMRAIAAFGIRKVVYSTNEQKFSILKSF